MNQAQRLRTTRRISRDAWTRATFVALAIVVVAMQWFAASHRASHALYGTSAELFLEHARAHAAANEVAAAHRHDHHDPFSHHSDASACVLFDAALAATPVAEPSSEFQVNIARRERGFAPTLPLVASHVLRPRVRDPPALA
jgi:hypothetical protein